MISRLLNTLRYRLRRELKEWRKANRSLRASAWPWYQKALIAAGKHPVRVPLILLIAALLLSAVIWGYHAFSALVSSDPPSPLSGERGLE